MAVAELIGEKAIAARLGRSIWSLRRWRKAGIGPPFYEINGRISYLGVEVDEWLKQKRR